MGFIFNPGCFESNLWVLLYEENIKYNKDHPLCIAHCTLIKPQMGKLFYFMKYRALSREIFHLVIFITSENKMEFFSLISLEMIHVFVCCLIYSLDYLKLPANSLQFLVIFFPLSNGAAQKLKLRELWSSIFASCWYQSAFIPSTHKKPTLLMHSEITFHRRHLPVKDKNKENY